MFLYSTHLYCSLNKINWIYTSPMFFLGMSLDFLFIPCCELVLKKFNPWLCFQKCHFLLVRKWEPPKSWTAAGYIINLELIWVWCLYIQLHIMTFHCTQAYKITRLPSSIPPNTSSCLFTGRSRPRAAPGL